MKRYIVVVILLFSCPNILFSTLGFPQAYFSSTSNLRKKLLSFIDQEQESIHAAIYFLTDKEIAQALCRAKKRGINVELIVDIGSVESEWTKVPMLYECGIPLLVYDGGKASIMHNKFFIFSRSTMGRMVVWTGSYNPTRKASAKNCENVVVLDDVGIAHGYEQEFQRLKKMAEPYEKKQGRQSDAPLSSRFSAGIFNH